MWPSPESVWVGVTHRCGKVQGGVITQSITQPQGPVAASVLLLFEVNSTVRLDHTLLG